MNPSDPDLSLRDAASLVDTFPAELLGNPAFGLWLLEDPDSASILYWGCKVLLLYRQLLAQLIILPEENELTNIGKPQYGMPREFNWFPATGDADTLDFNFMAFLGTANQRDLDLVNDYEPVEGDEWSYEHDGDGEAAYSYDYQRLWLRGAKLEI